MESLGAPSLRTKHKITLFIKKAGENNNNTKLILLQTLMRNSSNNTSKVITGIAMLNKQTNEEIINASKLFIQK